MLVGLYGPFSVNNDEGDSNGESSMRYPDQLTRSKRRPRFSLRFRWQPTGFLLYPHSVVAFQS